jgi:hypothetical protein
LQVRPVARAGRARTLAESTFNTASDHARMYLVVLALQQELPDVRINCDLAPAQGLWEQRDAYAGLLGDCDGLPYESRPLADLVNPLVITDTGTLKPIAYDFDDRFDVAAVDGLSPGDLRDYKRNGEVAAFSETKTGSPRRQVYEPDQMESICQMGSLQGYGGDHQSARSVAGA